MTRSSNFSVDLRIVSELLTPTPQADFLLCRDYGSALSASSVVKPLGLRPQASGRIGQDARVRRSRECGTERGADARKLIRTH